jgi:hypothetical protein
MSDITMQTKDRSRNFRERLRVEFAPQVPESPNPNADPHSDPFVETIRHAVTRFPAAMIEDPEREAPKRARVLHQVDNCAKSLRALVDEALDNEAATDDLLRLGAVIERAIRSRVKSRRPSARSAPEIRMAIVAETRTNSDQNELSNLVLITGSLGDCEKFWEATRLQREYSAIAMEAVEERMTELRCQAASR